MIDIIYITYHINNLKFSLKALLDINYEFTLTIHNDNPSVKLTKEWLLENCELDKINYTRLTILNEDENIGMLFSRIKSFRSIENSEYTLFMDDDDYLMIKNLPLFEGHYWNRYNIQYMFSNDLDDVGPIKCAFGICASFWKSELLDKAFTILENNPFESKINTCEDVLIIAITLAVAFKYKLPYLNHIDEIGFKYRVYKDRTLKYDHITDPRYCNTEANLTYMANLKKYQDKLVESIYNG